MSDETDDIDNQQSYIQEEMPKVPIDKIVSPGDKMILEDEDNKEVFRYYGQTERRVHVVNVKFEFGDVWKDDISSDKPFMANVPVSKKEFGDLLDKADDIRIEHVEIDVEE